MLIYMIDFVLLMDLTAFLVYCIKAEAFDSGESCLNDGSRSGKPNTSILEAKGPKTSLCF